LQKSDSRWADEEFRAYSASGDTSSSVHLSETSSTNIFVSLIILDTVTELGSVLEGPVITYGRIHEWFIEMTAMLDRNEGTVYPTVENRAEAIFRTMVTDRMLLPQAMVSCCRLRAEHWKPMEELIEVFSKTEPDQQEIDEKVKAAQTNFYSITIKSFAIGLKPYITSKGWIGLGSPSIEIGDTIAIPLGAKVPYAIRREEAGYYRLVGEVFTQGIMDGEIMEMGIPIEIVELR